MATSADLLGLVPVALGGRFLTQQFSSGAGRSSDWVFPSPMQCFVTGTAPTLAINRLNMATVAVTVGGFGGGGVNVVADSYNTGVGATLGAPVFSMGGNGVGAGQIVRFAAGPGAWVNIKKSKAGFPAGQDPYGCCMISAVYAITSRVPGTTNCGLEATFNGGPIGTNQGVAFQADSTTLNQVQFCTCQTTPTVVRTRVTPAGFDETKLNRYGIFFQSATKDTEAFIQPYINGLPAGPPYFWGTGTVLATSAPVMTAALPQLYVAQNATLAFRGVAGLCLATGPTLQNVL